MNFASSLPSIEALLPHRGTMLLLDRLRDFCSESTIAEYTPRHNAWYADHSGSMPGWIGIELMAQAIAAHVGMIKLRSGLPPKQGVLLGTKRYHSSVASFLPDIPLLVHVSMIYSDVGGLGAYDCRITSGVNDLATATLKVYEPKDFQTFLQGERT